MSYDVSTELIDKFIVDTQVHQIMYVGCVGSNNQWMIDNGLNYLSLFDHIIINDNVHGLTAQLGWKKIHWTISLIHFQIYSFYK